jgi:hypothetical protein
MLRGDNKGTSTTTGGGEQRKCRLSTQAAGPCLPQQTPYHSTTIGEEDHLGGHGTTPQTCAVGSIDVPSSVADPDT